MIEGSCRSRPALEELDDQQFFAIEGSCRSRSALEELDGQQIFAIEGSFLKALMLDTFLNKSSCVRTWTVKVHEISKDRWPVSEPKFRNRSRPEANMTNGKDETIFSILMLPTFMPSKIPSEQSRTRRQRGRCYQRSELHFYFFMRSKVRMLKLPVTWNGNVHFGQNSQWLPLEESRCTPVGRTWVHNRP